MENYYHTNYSKCSQPTSYFSSSAYVHTGVHTVTIFAVPLWIYGFYCIIKITPKQLGSGKWDLLIVHVWTVCLDITFNFLGLPYMFFPSLSILFIGSGMLIGIPPWILSYSIQSLVSAYTASFVAFFENRQNVLQTKWRIKKRWARVFIKLINYGIAWLTVLPPYLEKLDSEGLTINFLKKVPCPDKEYFNSSLFFICDNPIMLTSLMGFQFVTLTSQGVFYVSHTWYHLVFLHGSRVSAETRKVQLRFFWGTLLQVLIPMLVFMVPISYIWYSANTGYYNQAINNHISFTVSFHGLLGTSCMVLVQKSFRTHFLKMITFGKVNLAKARNVSAAKPPKSIVAIQS